MPRLEPALLPVVADLEQGLRTLDVPFAVVGALVPELLLDTRPTRMTNDADVTVMVESLEDFETLKDRLADFGFMRTAVPHRIDRFVDSDADAVGIVLREQGRLLIDDGDRLDVFEHFQWYRRGLVL